MSIMKDILSENFSLYMKKISFNKTSVYNSHSSELTSLSKLVHYQYEQLVILMNKK